MVVICDPTYGCMFATLKSMASRSVAAPLGMASRSECSSVGLVAFAAANISAAVFCLTKRVRRSPASHDTEMPTR